MRHLTALVFFFSILFFFLWWRHFDIHPILIISFAFHHGQLKQNVVSIIIVWVGGNYHDLCTCFKCLKATIFNAIVELFLLIWLEVFCRYLKFIFHMHSLTAFYVINSEPETWCIVHLSLTPETQGTCFAFHLNFFLFNHFVSFIFICIESEYSWFVAACCSLLHFIRTCGLRNLSRVCQYLHVWLLWNKLFHHFSLSFFLC